MDRETLYNYGFTIVSIIIVFALMVILIPSAQNITRQTDDTANDLLVSANDFSDNENDSNNYCTITFVFNFTDSPVVNPLENYPNKVRVKVGEKYIFNLPTVEGYSSTTTAIEGVASGDISIPVYYTVND